MIAQTRSIRVPEGASWRVTAAIASMSDSWHVGDGAGGAVVAAGDDWRTVLDAVVSSGADVVLLTTVPVDLAAGAPVPVVIDLGWNHDPAVTAARPHLARLLDGDSLVESTVTAAVGAEPSTLLMSQLTLLRALVGPVTELRLVRAGSSGYDVLGRLFGGGRVALTAMCSDAFQEGATVRVVKPLESVEVQLTSPSVASPGVVRLIDESGTRTLPTVWETSGRESLRLAAEAAAGRAGGDDLADLLCDLEAVQGLGLPEDRAPILAM